MREIKFRGKRKDNGQWVEGGLIHAKEGTFIFPADQYALFAEPDYHSQGMGCGLEDRGITDRYEAMSHGWGKGVDAAAENYPEFIAVIPETVGEFTGLLDKNGKEIWEGDLIAHTRFDRPLSPTKKSTKITCVVEWDNGDGANVDLNPAKKDNPSLYNTNPQFWGRTVECEASGIFYHMDWSEFNDCEVIGNIHEHPQLLKKEEEK